MEITIIINMLVSLISTIIIETIIVKLFLKNKKVIKYIILANLLTNPLIVFLANVEYISNFSPRNLTPALTKSFEITIILEIVAIFVESKVYKDLFNISKKKAFIISSISNICAFVISVICNFIVT